MTQPFTSPIAIIPTGAPGRPFPWGGLLVLASAVFLSVTAEMLPTGLLPEMSAELGVGQSQIGLLVSVFAFAVVLTSIPLSRLTRSVSRHRLIVLVLIVVSLSSAVTAIAPTFEILVGARIVGGMAHGLFWAVMGAYSGYLVPKEQLGRAVAITTGGGTLAFVLGVPLGTVLGQAVGWRSAFGAIAVLCIVGAALMLWLLPRVERPAKSDAPPERHPSGRRKLDATVPAVALLCLLAAVIMIGHYSFYTFIAPYLVGELGVDSGDVGLLLAIYGIAGAGGLLLAGTVFGRHPTLGVVIGVAVTAISVTVMALFAADPMIAIPAFVLWGLVFGTLPPLLGARMLHVASVDIRDTASAFYSTSFNVGIGGGALVGAALLDGFGLTSLPVAYLITLVLAGVLLVAAELNSRRRMARAD
ncbi:MFS transporter [Agreia sp. PsM10]|uniref:MFS transporter n=1 Tax=Agreia sp. PsM10 TaxID=3030533 RepID=UPI00263AFAD2|nr:MFS transporter [Agreia sp. PsM10]MDN4641163.1 MFS transporter [Agreia sp. PsM10]